MVDNNNNNNKNNNKTVLLIAIFHVILTSLIRNIILRFSVTLLLHYWYTQDIQQSLIYAIISTIISYILLKIHTWETFDAPKTLGDPLDLTGGSGALAEVRVQAQTPQSVMFSEQDDPDKPDDIVLKPQVPMIDLEKTREWAKERKFRQAIELPKEEPQLGTKIAEDETAALEPESFSSLFYY